MEFWQAVWGYEKSFFLDKRQKTKDKTYEREDCLGRLAVIS